MGKFIARVAEFESGKRYTGGGSGVVDPGKVAAKELPNIKGGRLFAYLFRRFGYPTLGWDGYKQLVEYAITTPQSGLFLTITPYMAHDSDIELSDDLSVSLMFGYLMEQEVEHEIFALGWKQRKQSTLVTSANKAIRIAVHDLLRPVNIRDYLINCYGRVPDDAHIPALTPYYHASGYPVVGDFYKDTSQWVKFCDALYKLGSGDYNVGMQKVMDFAGVDTEIDSVEVES
jgi:hypothetical protein